MERVKIVPLHKEKVDPKKLRTPIADAFNKIKNFNSPILSEDLLRKRQKVKKI